MPAWLVALVLLAGFMLVRGVAMLYLAIRVRRARGLIVRYWTGEVEYEAVGHRKETSCGSCVVRTSSQHASPRAEAIGLGQMVTGHLATFDNLFKKDADIIALVNDALMEAEGYYRDEARRSLIPVFWPSVLAHLPADVLVAVGVPPGGLAARAATALGWIATVSAFIVAVLRLLD